MSKLNLNKERGAIDDFIYIIVTIFIVFVLLIVLMPSFGIASTQSKLNQIGREYILRMETKGYLSSSDINELKGKIAELGVDKDENGQITKRRVDASKIVITASNGDGNKARYGTAVSLSIRIEYKSDSYNISTLLGMEKNEQDEIHQLKFYGESTSKCRNM